MNQCDGCRAGWEVRNGLHYDRHGKVQMGCTATRYPLSVNAIKTLPNGDTEAFGLHITSMVPEQPEALRLADWLERRTMKMLQDRQAAAELRRLWEAQAHANKVVHKLADRVQADTALLRQALEATAYWLEHGETPGAHDMIQRTHDALQERLK